MSRTIKKSKNEMEQKYNIAELNVLLGVSGAIAAYKAVDLASKLTKANAIVKTIMTKNARRFVGARSFEAVTNSAVFTKMWHTSDEYKISHINLSQWADVIVIAPATANIIAKIANGICDDLLSTTICASFGKPILIAPAMNSNMWQNPAVEKNVGTLKEMGFEFVGPGTGRLACGDDGIGRMAEPEEILEAIIKISGKEQ